METTAKPFDLTTIDGLRSYFTSQGQPRDGEISLLSGGSANYVYRVTDPDSTTRVYKHAAPYSHSNHNFALDVRRMNYEARILELLSARDRESLLAQQNLEIRVQAARLISYDEAQKLLCIGDGGSRNLKAAYHDAQLDVPKIGQGLAQWVAALHNNSKDVSLAVRSQDVTGESIENNNPVALHLYRHSYDNLHVALSEFGHDPELGVRINEEFGSLIATDNECICHGDFWPGNILIQPESTQDGAVQLTVVDWELVRRGTSATDVGQFAAEAFLHDRFKGGRGLFAAFVNSYMKIRSDVVDKAWIKRMIVHWAVHVAYWPTRVEWTDQEGTQQLVDMGVEVLKAVLDDSWGKLVELPLLRDVKSTLEPLLT